MKEAKTIGPFTRNEISIERKVSFLKDPAAYTSHDLNVNVKETHMSWVFLVNGFAYKLKKPVANRLFDFRSVQARLRNCREEVRLNRRLAKEVYVGIVPLVINKAGELQIEGKGKIVDWLVKMKRIPEEEMLDYAILHGSIDRSGLQRAARLLIKFYQASGPVPVFVSQYVRKLEADILFNYVELSRPLFQLSPAAIHRLTTRQTAFVTDHYSLFLERIKNKKIIEAHGDLRPEHIGIGPSPAIIDRLEFNKELRIMDIAEELSFLCVECEMLGNRTIGQLFLEEYIKATSDNIPGPLITFYKMKRACLRAYLVARHKEDERYRDDPGWLTKANAYIKLAESYDQQLAG